MTIIFVQILGLIVIIAILSLIIRLMRKEGIDVTNLLLLLIFIVLAVIVIVPDELSYFLRIVGFIRPLDAFLVIALVGSLLLSLKVYIKEREMGKDITKIVQTLAIKKVKRGKK